MACHINSILYLVIPIILIHLVNSAKNPVRRYHHLPDSAHAHSFYVPQVLGYSYPGPVLSINNNNKPIVVRHETIVASASSQTSNTAPPPPVIIAVKKQTSSDAASPTPTATSVTTMNRSTTPTTKQQHVITTLKVKATTEVLSTTTEQNDMVDLMSRADLASDDVNDSSISSEEMKIESRQNVQPSASMQDDAKLMQAQAPEEERMVQIKSIDVACGKERMTVRITFDDRFNGIIYAKGHYSDPNCRFIGQNSGQKIYQFDMTVGQCGVSFIDAGLTSGGMAYVEGTLVAILEPGVQEAWDAARRIRCLWEGNIDQTVTFPLAINMLDSQTLTFSGDTASAAFEIQSGRGPRAQPVQGLVRIGELLTAVVTVQGDTDFDLVVRNCVATDGTPENRIILSDNMGCSTKPKLMGGWKKQKSSGNVAAYAYLTAFKFPDVMDLFLECTVSLCKGACDECPEYSEAHVSGHDSKILDGDNSRQNDVESTSSATAGSRKRRNLEERHTVRFNDTVPAESLRLRRVVHVVGPEDLPEVAVAGLRPTIYGGQCSEDCFSLFGVICTAVATGLVMFATIALCGVIRRNQRETKW